MHLSLTVGLRKNVPGIRSLAGESRGLFHHLISRGEGKAGAVKVDLARATRSFPICCAISPPCERGGWGGEPSVTSHACFRLVRVRRGSPHPADSQTEALPTLYGSATFTPPAPPLQGGERDERIGRRWGARNRTSRLAPARRALSMPTFHQPRGRPGRRVACAVHTPDPPHRCRPHGPFATNLFSPGTIRSVAPTLDASARSLGVARRSRPGSDGIDSLRGDVMAGQPALADCSRCSGASRPLA
jgi:hypothetical protein